jgi:hypothetical protein
MSWLSKTAKKAERWVSNSIPHQHSAERRAANQAVAEQIDYYQKAKEEIATESKRTEDERAADKKKIAEKQIKSMKRAYRSPGFLEEASGDMGNKLG